MKKIFKINAVAKQILADTVTPVAIYLRVRDKYPKSILLEGAEFQPGEEGYSFICFDSIGSIEVKGSEITELFPDGTKQVTQVSERTLVQEKLKSFLECFKVTQEERFQFLSNGLFGYSSYDAVQFYEDIKLTASTPKELVIPELSYNVYRYIIAINHYRHETFLLENALESEDRDKAFSDLEELEHILKYSDYPRFKFGVGEFKEHSNFTDEEHLGIIAACKKHVYRGDVFQIVPSRRFEQRYYGDEFNVYRALRVINPSPYMFFYDCGDFKIFGSSPEAELIVQNRKATIYPIAGTYKRTGNEKIDSEAVGRLLDDPKENAEHVMLVDLARNDLSIHCKQVEVERFRDIHSYSHVIHLVSRVSGTMNDEVNSIDLLADTFPAGTLSGAPKYRAMELIDRYEKVRRGIYGGAIGYLGFNGSCTHAIIIRSFLAKNNTLYRQAGGGVVADSVPESEVQEVRNKLEALKKALELAEEF